MNDAPDHHDDPALVRHARAPVRRGRRQLQLHLSRLGISERLFVTCLIPPALWTIGVLALSVAVRY